MKVFKHINLKISNIYNFLTLLPKRLLFNEVNQNSLYQIELF